MVDVWIPVETFTSSGVLWCLGSVAMSKLSGLCFFKAGFSMDVGVLLMLTLLAGVFAAVSLPASEGILSSSVLPWGQSMNCEGSRCRASPAHSLCSLVFSSATFHLP